MADCAASAARAEARRLRADGLSLGEICREIGQPKGRVYHWVRDLAVSAERRAEFHRRAAESANRTMRRDRPEASEVRPMTAVPGPGYDPKGVGDMSMSQVMASLLKCGMRLLLPFGDNQRYDLAVDEDGRLVRVQCKTAQFCGDKFTFSPNSVNWNTRQRRDYRGQADVFAVYVRELDRTFIVNVDRCPVRSCTIRLTACHLKSARTAEAHEMRPGRSLLDYP